MPMSFLAIFFLASKSVSTDIMNRQYVEGNKEVAHHEMPLTLLAHFADLWTATVYEEGRKIVESTDYYDKKD